MMRRYRFSIVLLILGAVASASLAAWLFFNSLWAQGCLALILPAACMAALLRLQSRLISTMSAFVSALEMNDTTFRVHPGGDAELRSMSDAMNRISELYRDNMRELQTRKLYYDRVLNIMTHEMRNGITPIASISADMLDHPERYNGQKLAEATRLINSQAEGIRRFLDSYHHLTHVPEPRLENISAKEYFRSLKKILAAELERRGITEETVSYTIPEDMTLTIDPSLFNQVMVNLVRNSLDALHTEGGAVKIVLSISDSRPFLTVTDNGYGIPPETMESLFTPFFTTKPNGSGVGLAISRQIIRKHGGDIRIQSSSVKGTTVIISL